MSKFLFNKFSYNKFVVSPARLLKLKRKHIFSFAFFVVAALAVVISFGLLRFTVNGAATLILSFQDINERVFRGEVINDMTVLDAILASAEAGDINFRYFINENNEVKIVMINGYNQSETDKKLVFSLNGDSIEPESIHKTFIGAGDEIKINILSVAE